MQGQRVDNLTDSVHKVQQDIVNNADTFQMLLVSMENLGDNFRQLREEMLTRGNPEQQMEIEGDVEHEDLTAALLQAVSLLLTTTSEPIPSVLVSISQSTVNPELSQPSLILSPAVDAEIQTRFAKLRAGSQTAPENSATFSFGQNNGSDITRQSEIHPVPTLNKSPEEIQKGVSQLLQPLENEQKAQEEQAEKCELPMLNPMGVGQAKGSSKGIQTTTPRLFNMGSVPKRPYLGLDGRPRWITPIPISTAQCGRNSQSTIGNTSNSTKEEEIIKREVRNAIQRVFPGINIGRRF